MARGRQRVRAPARGAVSADAANTHGKRREGDEEDAAEQQRLTEQRNAKEAQGGRRQRRKATVHTGAHCSTFGTTRQGRKRRGPDIQGNRTSRGNCRTLMGRPELVGAVLPTRTVRRPPFWAGIARGHHGQRTPWHSTPCQTMSTA